MLALNKRYGRCWFLRAIGHEGSWNIVDTGRLLFIIGGIIKYYEKNKISRFIRHGRSLSFLRWTN
jgi:hypothetical protein